LIFLSIWQLALHPHPRPLREKAEYKHVVLGLLFLKYISDSFEEHRACLEAEKGQGAEPAPEDTEPFEEKMRRFIAQLRE